MTGEWVSGVAGNGKIYYIIAHGNLTGLIFEIEMKRLLPNRIIRIGMWRARENSTELRSQPLLVF